MKNFIFKVPSSEPEPNKQQLLLLLRSNRNEPLTGEHILIIHDVKQSDLIQFRPQTLQRNSSCTAEIITTLSSKMTCFH